MDTLLHHSGKHWVSELVEHHTSKCSSGSSIPARYNLLSPAVTTYSRFGGLGVTPHFICFSQIGNVLATLHVDDPFVVFSLGSGTMNRWFAAVTGVRSCT